MKSKLNVISWCLPETYRGGLVHIPSGTVTPPLTKGFSIAYFQGTHAHKPVNPTPCPEESLLSGKEYRITYIAYVNELLFSRVNTKKETAHIALDYSYFIGGVKGVGIIGRTFLENAGPYFGVPFVKPALDLNGKKLTELTVARPYPSTFQEHDQVEFPMSESEWKLWMAHESPECAYSFFIAKEYEWKSWRASVFSQSSGNNCPPYSSDLKLRIRIESAWFQNPYTLAKCKFPTQKYYPDEIEGNSMKKRIDDHLLLHECTIHSLASDAEAVKIVSKPTARRPLNAAGEITTHADKSGFSLRPKVSPAVDQSVSALLSPFCCRYNQILSLWLKMIQNMKQTKAVIQKLEVHLLLIMYVLYFTCQASTIDSTYNLGQQLSEW